MEYPDWVLKQKTKGTEIRNIGSNYTILPNILDKIIGITNMNIW